MYGYSATANGGRLTQAETVGAGWGQSFSYDGFGNLTAKNVVKGSVPVMNVMVDGATNRISSSGFAYDAAGNLTTMPYGGSSQTLAYDHDNRVTSVTNTNGIETYGYDGSNRRIAKTENGDGQGGTTTGYQQIETWFYFAGRMVARRDGSLWLTTGTTRIGMDRLSSVGDGSTYYPYGEEKTVTAEDKQKFATYYRDSQSGLDYAQQRYYSATYGRFTSGDPYAASAGPSDPGSWNRYAYVQGDPVNFNDPSGLAREEMCGYPCSINATIGVVPLLGTWETGGQRAQVAEKDRSGLRASVSDSRIARVSRNLDRAIGAALNALAKPDCAMLFSAPEGALSPQELLTTLQSGRSEWGYFALNVINSVDPDTITSAQVDQDGFRTVDIGNGATQLFPVIRITINIQAGVFTGTSAVDQAAVVIHELGHAYVDLFGPTASAIKPDGVNVSDHVKVSEGNTKTVKDNCFK